ncbi:MAG: hypothetical protein HZC12_06170 [Nitrospirae bacterium]|nr:hypothetical protein [Nitrospirota bacterium]
MAISLQKVRLLRGVYPERSVLRVQVCNLNPQRIFVLPDGGLIRFLAPLGMTVSEGLGMTTLTAGFGN